ncbi:hypothetical protein [Congregibacter sp.]|uniref:hypothetical protein n=1 Tax=Congregibacter sp. TaxID=2744308 RepID=UPI003F6B983F
MKPIQSTGAAVGLLLVVTLFARSVAAQERQMYRYTNAEGHAVVAYQVPPEFVANGYDILSPSGALVAVVPRTLNEGEREGLDSEARSAREAAEEAERMRRWDESLLLRYSTIEDIEAARDRELRDLRIRVSILKGKLRSLKQQVENYQALAADQERQGNVVNVEHLAAIDDLQAEIGSTERAVADRQDEIASVEADYQKDVERFSKLLDIVEMRKTMSAEN